MLRGDGLIDQVQDYVVPPVPLPVGETGERGVLRPGDKDEDTGGLRTVDQRTRLQEKRFQLNLNL